MPPATAEPTAKTEQATARILGKTIKLGADYNPDKHEIIRTVVPMTLKALDDEKRTIDFIGSTASHDRYNDVIVQTGWELGNFVKNPVIPWAHNYSEPPVAKAIEVSLIEGNLGFKGQWATAEEYAFADTIYRLYKGGYLRAFSVGFIPLEWELVKDEENGIYFRFTKCELLEVSCVTVPANQEALVLGFQDGSFNDRDKTLMIKQANKLIKSLTQQDDLENNELMQEELKKQLESVLAELAEVKALLAKQAETAASDKSSDEEPDEGTEGESKALTADEVRAQVQATIKSKIDFKNGKIE